MRRFAAAVADFQESVSKRCAESAAAAAAEKAAGPLAYGNVGRGVKLVHPKASARNGRYTLHLPANF